MDKKLKHSSTFFCAVDWITREGIILAVLWLMKKAQIPQNIYHMMVFFFAVEALFSVGMLIHILKPLRQAEQAVERIEKGTLSSNTDFIINEKNRRQRTSIDQLIGYIRQILKSNYDSQILKSQAEIHALQSQINPHFLYNTLETIRSQAVMQGCESIEEMTEALAVLFRYSISRPGEMATLREELENVENYLLIQHYRFPDKFTLEKQIEDERLLECKVPVLTLQPLVENAIHHGLEMKIGRGILRIRVMGTQERLIILISDDGLGIPYERLEEIRQALEAEDERFYLEPMGQKTQMGIALINVNRRIRFYFGRQYGLHIYSTKDAGTTVELSLPSPLAAQTEEKKNV